MHPSAFISLVVHASMWCWPHCREPLSIKELCDIVGERAADTMVESLWLSLEPLLKSGRSPRNGVKITLEVSMMTLHDSVTLVAVARGNTLHHVIVSYVMTAGPLLKRLIWHCAPG